MCILILFVIKNLIIFFFLNIVQTLFMVKSNIFLANAYIKIAQMLTFPYLLFLLYCKSIQCALKKNSLPPLFHNG